MGKASISIAVTGSYNGAALERAEKRLDSIAIKTAGASKSLGGMRIGSADVEDAALRLAEDASIDPEATARPTRQGGWYGYGGSKDTGLPTYGNTYYYSIVVDGRTVSSSRRLEGAVRELAALAASGSDY